MKKIIRAFCFILLFCFIFTAFVACDGSNANSDGANSGGSSLENNGQTPGDDEKEDVFRLDKEDFGGVTIKIMTDKASDYLSCEIAPLELTDERVRNAAYNRAQLIAQEYGIKIEQVWAENQGDVKAKAKEQAETGIDEIQVFCGGIIYLAGLVQDEVFIDMNSIESNNYLDFTQDYWDQRMIEDISIKDRIYFATGDALVTDDEATWAMFFNKDIATNNNVSSPYGAESIYEIAKRGEWTIDVMYEMAKTVSNKVGDKMDYDPNTEDTWGMVAQCYDSYTFMVAAGQSLTRLDNDLPIVTIGEEQNIRAYEKVFSILTDKQTVAIAELDRGGLTDYYGAMSQIFANGRALFMPNKVATVSEEVMRTANIRYGILPMPKLSKEQENYSSTVTVYWCSALAIPQTNVEKLDATCYALEALAYYGKKNMTKEYYEQTLKNKRFEDTESEEMLDLIFRNKSFDIGAVYSFGDILGFYTNILISGSNTHASNYDAAKDNYEIQIEDFLATIE